EKNIRRFRRLLQKDYSKYINRVWATWTIGFRLAQTASKGSRRQRERFKEYSQVIGKLLNEGEVDFLVGTREWNDYMCEVPLCLSPALRELAIQFDKDYRIQRSLDGRHQVCEEQRAVYTFRFSALWRNYSCLIVRN
ncbi:PIPO, partial [Triticum mosaic virus]|uniref:PIPO n=1 Tax=Triticum mosaic virus TaxID=431317 RepID=UPI0001D1E234